MTFNLKFNYTQATDIDQGLYSTNQTPTTNGKISDKKSKPKPRYFANLSEEAQMRMVAARPSNIRKIWHPYRRAQLLALMLDFRTRNMICGPKDVCVGLYIRKIENEKARKASRTSAQVSASDDDSLSVEDGNEKGEPAHLSSGERQSEATLTAKAHAKDLSQYYTPPSTAEDCMSQLMRFLPANLSYSFIEPSAGHGPFVDAAKTYGEVIGFDIDPKRADIIKADFLREDIAAILPRNWNPNNTVIIGNPPFGKKSRDAIAFLNKGLELGQFVAFILPKNFRRYGIQSKVNPKARLIYDENLSCNKFIFCGKRKPVECCFQIWTLGGFDTDKRIKTKPPVTHKDFTMCRLYPHSDVASLSKKDWDLALLSQTYRDYKPLEKPDIASLARKHWILIKTHNPDALKRLCRIDFHGWASRCSVGPKSISCGDIVAGYRAQDELDRCKKANDG